MKVLIVPMLAVYMMLVGFTATNFGVGNSVFTDDSCLDNPPCTGIIDGGEGFFGAILGFFKTIFNFFGVFVQIMTFSLDINPYANLFIVGFISLLAFTTIYTLLRQG